MEVPESIAGPIRQRAIALTRGEIQPDELDSHATLARLKIAGLFAILDGRMDITDEDWALAGVFQRTSHHVRAVVLAAVQIEQRQLAEAATSRHVSREGAVVDDQVARAIHRMARAIGRHVHKAEHDEGCKMRCARHAVAGRDRAVATVEEAIARAVLLRWITVEDDVMKRGEAMPT